MTKLILSVTTLLLALGASQSVHAATVAAPDSGASLCLLAIGLAGIGAIARKLK